MVWGQKKWRTRFDNNIFCEALSTLEPWAIHFLMVLWLRRLLCMFSVRFCVCLYLKSNFVNYLHYGFEEMMRRQEYSLKLMDFQDVIENRALVAYIAGVCTTTGNDFVDIYAKQFFSYCCIYHKNHALRWSHFTPGISNLVLRWSEYSVVSVEKS